ncbi:MAG TPA: hypothetical protein VGC66_00515, partial [Pyrinomonadaceae bacterium]
MKQCSVCQEEFADKFSFCPVDGTPLNKPAAQAVAPAEETATIPASTPSPDAVQSNVVLQQTMATVDATPASSESSNGSFEYTYEDSDSVSSSPRENEYHLTIIEERSIIGRLLEELREIAHDAQLTWPEFKRDPFGFTRRGI